MAAAAEPDADPTSLLLTVLILAISYYSFRFVHSVGMYPSIMSWQFTIWSLHIAPMVALCDPAFGRAGSLLCLSWPLFSWACRDGQVSLFSLAFLPLEAAAALSAANARFLAALCAAQALIAAGYWAGILSASRQRDFSFAPMDRHLHRGLRHLATCAAARLCLLHELLSHLLAQALLAALLLRRLGGLPDVADVPDVGAALADLAGLLAGYAACVLLAAISLPPHQLPYNLGTLPQALHLPVSMPAWLRGQGANGSHSILRLPWWMQLPAETGSKHS